MTERDWGEVVVFPLRSGTIVVHPGLQIQRVTLGNPPEDS